MRISKEHEEFRKRVREFAEKELEPKAKELDEIGEFSFDNIKQLSKSKEVSNRFLYSEVAITSIMFTFFEYDYPRICKKVIYTKRK